MWSMCSKLTMLVFFILGAIRSSYAEKILILVIASDDKSIYIKEQAFWRSYMNSDPDIKVFFMKLDPNLAENAEVHGDVIYTKGKESYIPGILQKTVSTMEFCLERFGEFDYIFRTNLSSFVDLKKLKEFASKLPKKKCYAGSIQAGKYCSGSGFFLSKDMVELIVRNMDAVQYNLIDDVAIGMFMRDQNITMTAAPRVDITSLEKWEHWLKGKAHDPTLFHFRIKQSGKRSTRNLEQQRREETIYRTMVDNVYGIQLEEDGVVERQPKCPTKPADDSGSCSPRDRKLSVFGDKKWMQRRHMLRKRKKA